MSDKMIHTNLTPREQQIVITLLETQCLQKTLKKLGMTRHTLYFYLANIEFKFGCLRKVVVSEAVQEPVMAE